jgi:serine/threonine protein kinase
MSTFDPQPGTQIRIGTLTYAFMPQCLLLGDAPSVYMIEGQEGFIYVLRNLEDDSLWALKVLKPAYRGERVVQVTSALSRYGSTPGFALSQRTCLTKSAFSQLVAQFPTLEYSLLMPWLSQKTWAGLMCSPEASLSYTLQQALDLALATTQVLHELEQHGNAHTDIAGSNVMYTSNFKQVELLDLEGLYVPKVQSPKWLSYGSPGYQHRRLGRRGQWSQYGDRFAGAILLTEMLTWWNPLVRAQVPRNASALFLPEELQKPAGPRWQIVRDVLWSLDPTLLNLFDQVWSSLCLKGCPNFVRWLGCLSRVKSKAPSPLASSSPPLSTLQHTASDGGINSNLSSERSEISEKDVQVY